MDSIESYDIPEDFMEIESGTSWKFEQYKSLIPEFRENETTYIKQLSAMMYFEEAFEKLRAEKFNLKNVQLIQCLEKINTFTIECDNGMPDFRKVINDSTINELKIKSAGSNDKIASGHFKDCDTENIFSKIDEGFEDLSICCTDQGQFFDIYFVNNQSSFKLQHNALNFIQEHHLFPILIKNPLYVESKISRTDAHEGDFR